MRQVQERTGASPLLGAVPRTQPDIQLLRAIAVLSVVVFHLSSTLLPGGYVGVDVFFVVSGYLITSHLARQADETGRVDLPAFWARRIRRLLPAALLVLAVTAVLIWRSPEPSRLLGRLVLESTLSALVIAGIGPWYFALQQHALERLGCLQRPESRSLL